MSTVILGPNCEVIRDDDGNLASDPTVCWCHVDPQAPGFYCSSCGCRTIEANSGQPERSVSQ